MEFLNRDLKRIWSDVEESAGDFVDRLSKEEIKPIHVEEVGLSVVALLMVSLMTGPGLVISNVSQSAAKQSAALALAQPIGDETTPIRTVGGETGTLNTSVVVSYDVNRDGVINTRDLEDEYEALASYVESPSTWTLQMIARYDFNLDRKISLADAKILWTKIPVALQARWYDANRDGLTDTRDLEDEYEAIANFVSYPAEWQADEIGYGDFNFDGKLSLADAKILWTKIPVALQARWYDANRDGLTDTRDLEDEYEAIANFVSYPAEWQADEIGYGDFNFDGKLSLADAKILWTKIPVALQARWYDANRDGLTDTRDLEDEYEAIANFVSYPAEWQADEIGYGDFNFDGKLSLADAKILWTKIPVALQARWYDANRDGLTDTRDLEDEYEAIANFVSYPAEWQADEIGYGDFNFDGKLSLADAKILWTKIPVALQARWYDANRDGLTDTRDLEDEYEAIANFVSYPAEWQADEIGYGDFNFDGKLSLADAKILWTKIPVALQARWYDVNRNGVVNIQDFEVEYSNLDMFIRFPDRLSPYTIERSDFNFDGKISLSDIKILWTKLSFEEQAIRYDVNHDGVLGVQDLVQTKEALASYKQNPAPWDPERVGIYDFNFNGKIDTTDVYILQKKIASVQSQPVKTIVSPNTTAE